MSIFFKEVMEQPGAIRKTLQDNQEKTFYTSKPLLLTGMGSSLAASELFVALLNANGVQATALDNSELLYYYSEEFLNKHQVIVISQSGESFEAIELVGRYSKLSAITNSLNSTLDKQSQEVFYTQAGKEEAIASSKSFTSTVALLLQIGSKMIGKDYTVALEEAVDVMSEHIEKANVYMEQIGSFFNPEKPILLLGRGPSIYTARQGALTLKETARIFSEALSAPQFRHGPFELLEEKDVQVIFFNPKGETYEINRNFVKEVADFGAKVLYVSDEGLLHENVQSIEIPSINEYVSVITYSLVIQLAAVELAKKRGLVAGEAKIISKVTGKE